MWLFVSSCVYEIPRLVSLLVGLLACIASKDERDIPSKLPIINVHHHVLMQI